ncbi:hypothetical protein TrLO_g2842 [Triparma laevis f. longispina]|uniref:Uncharacterized protein n=1 Tax=Triparma laevis f. longispina TaxID=1714387 RepID=A0A9W7CFW9_9STRA|nr:hypothetical protein TrLO_g2842 [Triparma laevis f. longispina]
MIIVYIGIKLIGGIVPKAVLDKHIVSFKKVLAMKLNAEEFVQFFGLSIAAVCALYLLGNYSARGKPEEGERNASLAVVAIGNGCLIVNAVWKMVVIRKELKAGEDEAALNNSGADETHSSTPSTTVYLTEGHTFWSFLAVLATTFSSLTFIASIATKTDSLFWIFLMFFPLVFIFYICSLAGQPRRRSPQHMWRIRLHVASFIWPIVMASLVYLVENNHDEDLERFLVGNLFTDGFQVCFSVLFLTFMATRCIQEKGGNFLGGQTLEDGFNKCKKSIMGAFYLASFLVLWWLVRVVDGSLRSEWRKELSLSVTKIATMNVSFRRSAQGLLTLVTGVCGIFLFSEMSAERETDVEEEFEDWGFMLVVGNIGLCTSIVSLLSEIYSVLKAMRRKSKISGDDDNQANRSERSGTDNELVQECSWVFVAEAKLGRKELSEFICQDLLLKGTGAIVPMVFFASETLTCITNQTDESMETCYNTAVAGIMLSGFMAVLTVISIIHKMMPRRVQKATAWEDYAIARVDLKWWQQLQGGLFVVTGVSAIFMLSALGVEGKKDHLLYAVGAVGGCSLGIAFLIGAIELTKTYRKFVLTPTTLGEGIGRSQKAFSSGDVSGDLVLSTFVI